LTFFYLLDVVKLWIPQGSDKSIEKHCILQLQNNNKKNKYGSKKWSSPKEWVGYAKTKVNGVLAW
jgi:hypothetical protein